MLFVLGRIEIYIFTLLLLFASYSSETAPWGHLVKQQSLARLLVIRPLFSCSFLAMRPKTSSILRRHNVFNLLWTLSSRRIDSSVRKASKKFCKRRPRNSQHYPKASYYKGVIAVTFRLFSVHDLMSE